MVYLSRTHIHTYDKLQQFNLQYILSYNFDLITDLMKNQLDDPEILHLRSQGSSIFCINNTYLSLSQILHV